MESTGVYWIPVYDLIEDSGILVNAHHIKNVPGRIKKLKLAFRFRRLKKNKGDL